MTFRALLAVVIAMLVMAAAPQRSEAATGAEIDADVYKTLQSFERQIGGARDLAGKAAGILVFPSVVKAGIGLGGEYGEGLLIIRGRPGGYYNIVSGSFGFQLGVQVRSVIIMFMTESALASFSSTYGWKAGVDGSIAIVTLGAGGAIDTESLTSPVLGFILDPAGLMYNLTLEGSKICRITRCACRRSAPERFAVIDHSLRLLEAERLMRLLRRFIVEVDVRGELGAA